MNYNLIVHKYKELNKAFLIQQGTLGDVYSMLKEEHDSNEIQYDELQKVAWDKFDEVNK